MLLIQIISFAQKPNYIEIPDSVKISYEHQKLALKAFIELRYYKRIDSANIRLLDFRQSQIKSLEHSLEYYKGAYKQCDEVTVPNLKEGNRLRDEKFEELKKTLKKDKSKSFWKGFGIGMGTGVVVETAIILAVKFAIPK